MFSIIAGNGFSKQLKEGEELVLGRGVGGIVDTRVSRQQVKLLVKGGKLLVTVKGVNTSSVDGKVVHKDETVEAKDGCLCHVLFDDSIFPFRVEEVKSASATASNKRARREECKYGASCYRKNPEHLEEFSHPWDKAESAAFAEPAAKKAAPAPPSPSKKAVVAEAKKSDAPAASGKKSETDTKKSELAKRIMQIGKHKGKSFAQIIQEDPSYASWANGLSNPGEEMGAFVVFVNNGLPKQSSSSKSQQPSQGRNEELEREWNANVSVVRHDSALQEASAVLAPVKQQFGHAVAAAAPTLSGRAESAASAEPLASVVALPLMGVNNTLQVNATTGVRVCADAVNAFLAGRPDFEATVVVVAPNNELRDSLARLLRDKSRSKVVAASGVGEWCAGCADPLLAPGFVCVETTWRLAPVPKSGAADLARLVAGGPDALRARCVAALAETGLDTAEPGRAYLAGPLPRSFFTVAGLHALPRARFVCAVVAPNCNPAKADCLEQQHAEHVLRAAYDAALDAFCRGYNKYCD